MLSSELHLYQNPEMTSNRVIADDLHIASIKLVFLANMRSMYESNFFGGRSSLSTEFFDRWWTIRRTDECLHVSEALESVTDEDFQAIASTFPEVMVIRLMKLRNSNGGSDPTWDHR